MKDNKLNILKLLLSGKLNSKQAASQLQKALNPKQGLWIFTAPAGGLYSGHGYTDITEDEAREIAVGGNIFLIEQFS